MNWKQRTIAAVISECLRKGVITREEARRLAHQFLRDKSDREAMPSLMEHTHVYEEDHCYSWVEYGWLPEDVTTDEEAEAWCDARIITISPYYDFDCTGQVFTWLISWHRNPNGRYTYVHHKALDV